MKTADEWNCQAADKFDAGDHAGALEAMIEAIQLKPYSRKFWANIGRVLQSLRRLDDAERAYKIATASPDAHFMETCDLLGIRLGRISGKYEKIAPRGGIK
jgi:tetratricopeptide (TPR) repeat protein